MRPNKTVIVVRIVFALLILYAIFGLISKNRFYPGVVERWRCTSGVVVCD